MIGQEDLSLIQSILQGDKESEEFLYEKYHKIVKDYLKRKYPNNHYIDDDVSEILIKIFTTLDSYQSDRSKFRSWVFTIAKNYMIDKSRRNDVLTGSITLDNVGVDVFSDGITTGDTLFLNDNMNTTYTSTGENLSFETCDTVDYVMNQFTLTDCAFLNMKYSLGYNYSEIGTEFNISSNTVSNRVNYLKTKAKNNADGDINLDE